LKTPVSTISVALEALQNFDAGNDPKLRKEYIEISKIEAARLDMLVNKTLNISLYEQGTFVMDKQLIDLKKLLVQTLRILKPSFDQKSVEFNFVEEGTSFTIHADKTHITNVLFNLLENAVKYSSGAAKIKLELTEKPDAIQLGISDQGIGIDSSFQDKIFEKFFRVPQGDIHNVKGHGLGLSYVKEVISKHEGTIEVKSELGKGSTFILDFPKPETTLIN
jgi:signal transduction histidine kinase